jgi:magnesium transporter
MSITAHLFDSAKKDKQIEINKIDVSNISENQLLWIEVKDESEEEIKNLAEILGLKTETVKNLTESGKTPKLHNFHNYFQITVIAVAEDKKRMFVDVPISFVVGKNWVLTKYERQIEYFDEFRNIDEDTNIGELNAESFVAALLDWQLSSYFRILANIEQEVDKIDEKILAEKSDEKILDTLFNLRKNVSQLRRILLPHQDVFYPLLRPDFNEASEFEADDYFVNLKDRFERLVDAIENVRDVVLSSFELFTTKTAHSTNELIKVLTFATLLIGGIGVIAGILGMNFELDFYKSGMKGFLLIIGGMTLLIIGSLLIAKIKKWF